jgi:hypothetical protein
MADETTTSWADLLRESKGPLVEALKYKTVLLSELKRDKSARRWNGKQITIPIWLAPEQGTGGRSRGCRTSRHGADDAVPGAGPDRAGRDQHRHRRALGLVHDPRS